MKTALLLSGKCEEHYYDSIYKTLIEPYNSDIFISSWIDNINIKYILDLYKPSLSKFESLSSVQNLKDKFLDFSKKNGVNPYKSTFHMFYKLYDVNNLRKEYENRNNVKYDLIIKSRFDLNFGEKMKCSQIEPFIFNKIDDKEINDAINNNYLYLRTDPYLGGKYITYWIWDQFAFGNDHNMNIYCNTFENLEKIISSKRDYVDINEKVLYYNLVDNGVKYKHTHTTYKISTYK